MFTALIIRRRRRRQSAGTYGGAAKLCERCLLFWKCSTSFVFYMVSDPQEQSYFEFPSFRAIENFLPVAGYWSLPDPLLLFIMFCSHKSFDHGPRSYIIPDNKISGCLIKDNRFHQGCMWTVASGHWRWCDWLHSDWSRQIWSSSYMEPWGGVVVKCSGQSWFQLAHCTHWHRAH